jgi:hypothetical protein
MIQSVADAFSNAIETVNSAIFHLILLLNKVPVAPETIRIYVQSFLMYKAYIELSSSKGVSLLFNKKKRKVIVVVLKPGQKAIVICKKHNHHHHL